MKQYRIAASGSIIAINPNMLISHLRFGLSISTMPQTSVGNASRGSKLRLSMHHFAKPGRSLGLARSFLITTSSMRGINIAPIPKPTDARM